MRAADPPTVVIRCHICRRSLRTATLSSDGSWSVDVARQRVGSSRKRAAACEDTSAHGWTTVELIEAGRARSYDRLTFTCTGKNHKIVKPMTTATLDRLCNEVAALNSPEILI